VGLEGGGPSLTSLFEIAGPIRKAEMENKPVDAATAIVGAHRDWNRR
jgi:hypothetical protein